MRAGTELLGSRMDPSGVPGLDEVLGGGLPRGGLALVLGPPGSGKTTLAAQIAFAAARAGRRALVLTAYSEPTTKLVDHLRTLKFFDEKLLGHTINIIALDQYLAQGLEATADDIVAEARRRRDRLVVVDSFRSLRSTDVNAESARRFLYRLGLALSLVGATALVTTEADPRDGSQFSEATTADVLIATHYRLDGVQARRGIEVIKVRGSQPLLGMHGFSVSAAGTEVYPRLEARVTAAEGDALLEEDDPAIAVGRASFGLPELDALLNGGLTRDTPALVLGSPGTGKTLLGLQFALAGTAHGEPAVYLTFHETPRELRVKADAFSLGDRLAQAIQPGGSLTLVRQPSVERDPDIVADKLLKALDATHARRLVVDSLSVLERSFQRAGHADREADYLAALAEALRMRSVTTLFLKDTSLFGAQNDWLTSDQVSVIAATVIWLQQVNYRGMMHRIISVPKMRFSAHDVSLREFTLSSTAGLQVLSPIESDGRLLEGVGRQHQQAWLVDEMTAMLRPHGGSAEAT